MSDERDYLMDPRAEPDATIRELEEALRPLRWAGGPLATDRSGSMAVAHHGRSSAAWRVAVLLVAAGLVVAVALQRAGGARQLPWAVTTIGGRPSVSGAPDGRIASGGAVVTDAMSRARITIGSIGRADLGPSSQVRVVRTGGAAGHEHRLALVHGRLHARVDAPPRWFVVETASALAVDLGCEYTLTVNHAGGGTLVVYEGEVELQRGSVRSSVLAGNVASLRPGDSPGLPRPARAGAGLASAVARWEAAPADAASLDPLLDAASASHATITLWHLLQRTGERDRGRVFDALVASGPTPPRLSRNRALALDSYELQRWRTALEPSWRVDEPVWRSAWRRIAVSR